MINFVVVVVFLFCVCVCVCVSVCVCVCVLRGRGIISKNVSDFFKVNIKLSAYQPNVLNTFQGQINFTITC